MTNFTKVKGFERGTVEQRQVFMKLSKEFNAASAVCGNIARSISWIIESLYQNADASKELEKTLYSSMELITEEQTVEKRAEFAKDYRIKTGNKKISDGSLSVPPDYLANFRQEWCKENNK